MQLFRNENYRVESIIILSKRMDCNTTCTNAVALENKIENGRITRKIGNILK